MGQSFRNNTNNLPADQTYFQSNYNQINFFNNVQNSLYRPDDDLKKDQNKNQLNPTLYLNNIDSNNLLINTHDFNDFTQSEPFNTKLDFSQKNHLLIQDDDDENDEDIELVNSILSSTSENLDSNDIIGTSIDTHAFLPWLSL